MINTNNITDLVVALSTQGGDKQNSLLGGNPQETESQARQFNEMVLGNQMPAQESIHQPVQQVVIDPALIPSDAKANPNHTVEGLVAQQMPQKAVVSPELMQQLSAKAVTVQAMPVTGKAELPISQLGERQAEMKANLQVPPTGAEGVKPVIASQVMPAEPILPTFEGRGIDRTPDAITPQQAQVDVQSSNVVAGESVRDVIVGSLAQGSVTSEISTPVRNSQVPPVPTTHINNFSDTVKQLTHDRMVHFGSEQIKQDKINLNLRPANLGDVSVEIKKSVNVYRLVIVTSTEEARMQIAKQKEMLAQMLSEDGSVEVEVDVKSGEEHAREFENVVGSSSENKGEKDDTTTEKPEESKPLSYESVIKK